MKLLTIASTILLAGVAIAAPGTAFRAERYRKRIASGRRGNPLSRVPAPSGINTEISNVDYSSNWAGAVLVGTGFTIAFLWASFLGVSLTTRVWLAIKPGAGC